MMDLLGSFFAPARASSWAPDDDRWYQPVAGPITESLMRVDEESARKISAWYRGRDILATALAMLPLQMFERLPNDGGAEVARAHPLYDVLHDEPNGWQDSFTWRRQKMYHLIDHGNGYDRIVPGPRGFLDQLQPIHPSLVEPEQLETGRILYQVKNEKTGQRSTLTQDEVFHVCIAPDKGVKGKGILAYARESVGTALATESYAAGIFGKGTLNGGVIETPGLLDPEASRRMAQSFITAAREWHLPKVLEQGAKWVQNEMTPEDAQMLLSRKHSIDDIARWLGIPRQMLMNSDPSFGNAEQFRQDFVDFYLGPWLTLFESAIKRQLILNKGRFYAEFNRDALVRGDIAVRWTAHVEAVNAGIKSVDEVRAKENLNKRGGKADELREPANITGKPPAPVPGKAQPPTRQAPAAAGPTRAEAIAAASAARLLRKEIAATQKAAVRHASDADAFVQAVTDFYAAHVGARRSTRCNCRPRPPTTTAPGRRTNW
jgi:HK97 family phage portal protein